MKQLLVILAFALASAPVSGHASLSVVDVQDIFTEDVHPGASALSRTPRAVDLTLHLTGLGANSAYTLWWVIFNNPEFCIDGCDIDDLGIAAVDASILWATGFVTGYEGVANVGARLRRGHIPGQLLVGNGLKDPGGAEIHVIVRSHGTVFPGEVDSQISELDGYCNPACVDTLFAVHLP